MRRGAVIFALLAGGAPLPVLVPQPLAAQRFWKNALYPYFYYSTVDGIWGGGHVGLHSPIGYVERPEPHLAAVAFDAAASTQGSYAVSVDAQAPAWWEGWRVALSVTAARANRLGFYGLGNESRYDKSNVTASQPYFYRVSRTTRAGRLTIQRRVTGPFRLLAGASLEHVDFRELPGGSQFRFDHASGAVDSSTVPFNDAALRAGLILDTRDHEIDPHRGALVEALVASGKGYRRTTLVARAYVRPAQRLVLATRLAGERMSGDPPVATQMVMESSERPFIAVGGYRSLRGYYDARFVGPGKLLGGLEARYALVWKPSALEVKLVAFYDAGRVFGLGEDVTITSDGLHTSGGAELAARIQRNALIVLGAGFGAEGGQILFGTTWSY